MIQPATVAQICDGIDAAGQAISSIAVALLVATTVLVTGALFLGLAIRHTVRSIMRRFASGKI